MAKAKNPTKWFAIYDSSPVADVNSANSYRKETSSDGRTWEHSRPSTGEFLKLDVADALYAGCTVEHVGGVATIQSPHPMGGFVRYTPIN
ncbi:hypothetical protein [Streptomyces prunicolor]